MNNETKGVASAAPTPSPPETPLREEAAEIEARVEETERSISQGARTSTHRFSLSDPCPRENSPVARAITALNDWLHIYAPDECGEALVSASKKRILDHGGTLAYIADVTAGLRSTAQGASPETRPLTIVADINYAGAAGEDWIQVTLSGPGVDGLTEAAIERALNAPPEAPLQAPDDEHLWRFWNEKARVQAIEIDRLRAIALDLQKHYTMATEALKPFAEAAARFDGIPVDAALPQQCWFTPNSLREARVALATDGQP